VIKNNTDYISQAEFEIKILNFIKRADIQDKASIVEYYDNFVFRNHIVSKINMKCIKFELLEMNLYEFIRDRDFIGLDEIYIRKIIKQVLYALVYMKRYNMIHCDLKPENILFKNVEKHEVKVTFKDKNS
jgi:serine/threonine protein kinase